MFKNIDGHMRGNLRGREAESTFASWSGPAFTRGEGCWLFDDDDERYFDASAGSGALNLGHGHPAVVEAIVNQASRLLHTGCKVQSRVRQELVGSLGELVPYHDPTILLTVIGTEAVEAALKVVRAATGRRRVIAFDRSYHGKSTGGLSVTWRDSLKRYSAIEAGAVSHCPAPLDETDVSRCLETLRDVLDLADRTGDPAAAVLVEPIQATEGVLVLGAEFLSRMAAIAREYGALVVFDEIYTGFGRCGSLFYFEKVGVTPDLLIVGKALANGLPIGAVIGSAPILNALGSGVQTSTFSGHPLACAAGLAVLNTFERTGLLQTVEEKGAALKQGLSELASKHQLNSQPRGAGLLLGFDCLGRNGKPSAAAAQAFSRNALKAGLLCNVGGHQGASVRLTPPLTVSGAEIEELVSRVDQVLQQEV